MSTFTEVQVNSQDYIIELLHLYGVEKISMFPSKSYISGSTLLKILTSNDKINNNDLDIYIERCSEEEARRFVDYFKLGDYTYKALTDTDFVGIDYITETKTKGNGIVHVNKYIHKVDFVIINCTIEEYMEKFFDFDILMNYMPLDYNIGQVIYTKLQTDFAKVTRANVSMNCFMNKELSSACAIRKFILRYFKYAERGYEIYMEGEVLTREKINLWVSIIAESNNFEFQVLKDYVNVYDPEENIIYGMRDISIYPDFYKSFKRNFTECKKRIIESLDMD
jgi:hypothetical protein